MSLEAEHALLLRELARTQQRITALMADQARQVRDLHASLLWACAELARRDAQEGRDPRAHASLRRFTSLDGT